MLNFEEGISGIDGWLTKREGAFLYEAARKIQSPNVIVEIGSWKGKSTGCLGKGSKDGGQAAIYAIDPHTGSPEHHRMFGKVDTWEEFNKNIGNLGVRDFVQPIRSTSSNAAPNFNTPIGLLFIDGAHGLEEVKLDFQLWFPKVINGGIIAFHDSWHSIGPLVVSSKALLTSLEVSDPKVVDSITWFKKVNQNTAPDRLKNTAFLSYRFLVGLAGFIVSKIQI